MLKKYQIWPILMVWNVIPQQQDCANGTNVSFTHAELVHNINRTNTAATLRYLFILVSFMGCYTFFFF